MEIAAFLDGLDEFERIALEQLVKEGQSSAWKALRTLASAGLENDVPALLEHLALAIERLRLAQELVRQRA